MSEHAGVAKAIDGFVANSTTTQDIVSALTDGDGTIVERVRGMVAEAGMTSEDVKNLTVSAVLAKLATTASSPEAKAEVGSIQEIVNKLGIGELGEVGAHGGALDLPDRLRDGGTNVFGSAREAPGIDPRRAQEVLADRVVHRAVIRMARTREGELEPHS